MLHCLKTNCLYLQAECRCKLSPTAIAVNLFGELELTCDCPLVRMAAPAVEQRQEMRSEKRRLLERAELNKFPKLF
jgi:hypothetical protein